MDGQIWALKADSLTSPLIVTETVTVKCYSSMGQIGFMVKKRNLPPLLSFSTLLVCILPHCRLRDWCGNLRKASGHVMCRLDQSASFRIFDSTFLLSAFRIPQFRILPIAYNTTMNHHSP